MEQDIQKTPVISIGDWMITIFILMIPLINIILLFIWAFSNSTNPNKSTFAKAYLIWIAIIIAITIIISVLLISAGVFGFLYDF